MEGERLGGFGEGRRSRSSWLVSKDSRWASLVARVEVAFENTSGARLSALTENGFSYRRGCRQMCG